MDKKQLRGVQWWSMWARGARVRVWIWRR